MDMRKIFLNASLSKLLERDSVEEHAKVCILNLIELCREIDEVRKVQKWREESDWTDRALAMASLNKVGNFEVKIDDLAKRRLVRFSQDNQHLEFWFEEKEPKDLMPGTAHAMQTPLSAEALGKIQRDFELSVLRQMAAGGSTVPIPIHLLGPDQFKMYVFKVLRLVSRSGGWKGFLGKNDIAILYHEG